MTMKLLRKTSPSGWFFVEELPDGSEGRVIFAQGQPVPIELAEEIAGIIAKSNMQEHGHHYGKNSNGWIPTAERLPEEGLEVTAYLDKGQIRQVVKDRHYTGGWKQVNCSGWEILSFDAKTITHWRPEVFPRPTNAGPKDAPWLSQHMETTVPTTLGMDYGWHDIPELQMQASNGLIVPTYPAAIDGYHCTDSWLATGKVSLEWPAEDDHDPTRVMGGIYDPAKAADGVQP